MWTIAGRLAHWLWEILEIGAVRPILATITNNTMMMMLQLVPAPLRTTTSATPHTSRPSIPTVKRDFTSYVCASCATEVSLEASHCGHCGQLRPTSALVERSRLLDLLFYFFRNDCQLQQHVEVELDTLRRLKGDVLAVDAPREEVDEDEISTNRHQHQHSSDPRVEHSQCADSSSKERNDNYEEDDDLEEDALQGNSINVAKNGANPVHLVSRSTSRTEHSISPCPDDQDQRQQGEGKKKGVLTGVGSTSTVAAAARHISPSTTEEQHNNEPQGSGEPDLVTPTKPMAPPMDSEALSALLKLPGTSLTCMPQSSAEIPREAYALCRQAEPYHPKDAPFVQDGSKHTIPAPGVASMPTDVSSEAPASHPSDASTTSSASEESQAWQDQQERTFKTRIRELENHLQPGIHDDTCLYLEKVSSDGTTRTTRSHFKWEKLDISRRSWTDPSVLTAEVPVHFPRAGYLEPRLVGVAAQLRMDFIKRCAAENVSAMAATAVAASCHHISTADEIKPGYMKGHLEEPFVSNVFAFTIPPCLLIKRRADQKAIAFITTHTPSQCDTHYDRDTSLLLMLAGKKEVFLAPPRQRWQDEVIHNNSTIFESVDPFLDLNRGTLGSEWKKIDMKQGDALLIPRKWLHAVRSHPGTVAVSFQVEIAPVPFDVPSYFNIPSMEEMIAASLLASEPMETEDTASVMDNDNTSESAKEEPAPQTALDEEAGSHENGTNDASDAGGASSRKEDEQEKSTSQDEEEEVTVEDSTMNKRKRKTSIEATMPLAQKRRLYLLQHPEMAPARKKAHRGGRRMRYDCDWCDCAGFAKDGEMWFLRLADEKDMDEKLLPMVTDHPVKFLCLSCVPRRGSSVVTPDVILEYPEELAAVEKYNFYLGTKVDYQVWSGESQKEQFL